MSTPMCQKCDKNAATVFIARVENGKADKQRLCESCAREITGESAWIKITGAGFDLENFQMDIAPFAGSDLEELDLESNPFNSFSDDELPAEFLELLELTGQDDDESEESGAAISDEEFAAMMEAAGIDLNQSVEENLDETKALDKLLETESASPAAASNLGGASTPKAHGLSAERCAKCGTTWDRLREDGRVGCAQCYSAFHEKLTEVMGRMQREPHHVGKTPREAQRRHRRLEHLRARRDHRLEMLNRRLQEAVTSENFEDAARLRDKIKMVSSTIVADE